MVILVECSNLHRSWSRQNLRSERIHPANTGVSAKNKGQHGTPSIHLLNFTWNPSPRMDLDDDFPIECGHFPSSMLNLGCNLQ